MARPKFCSAVFATFVVSCPVGLAACVGDIESGTGSGASERGDNDDNGGMGSAGASKTGASGASLCKPRLRGGARESVRRLTREELRATLNDLLPAVAVRVDADIDGFPNGFDALDTFVADYSDAQVSQWFLVADKVGSLVAANAQARSALGSDACLGAAAVTTACWQATLRGFLRRAFRRPVSEAEVDKFASYAAGKDAVNGTHAVVARILLSPDFLFRIESGSEETGADRVRLTEHEIASRISYGMAGTMPDGALADAADAGQLETLAQVEAHVRRLLDTPGAKTKIQQFFTDWLHLHTLPSPEPRVYAQWAGLPGPSSEAADELHEDVSDFVDNVVFKEQGSWKALMSKPASYTSSPMLAAIYGPTSEPMPGTSYETPNHPGLPFRAGLLASSGLNTNPILRGAKFLERFLCAEFPEPDPTEVAKAQQTLQTLDPRTTPNHERVSAVTSPSACGGCHRGINAMGFLLESYDQVGRWRTTETYIADVGGMLDTSVTHPLPGPVADLDVGAGLPTTFADPIELSDALAQSEAARACVSTILLRNLERRHEDLADACALGEIEAALAADEPMLDAFVKSIANEDIFWRGL